MKSPTTGNYKINCRNIRGFIRLIDYNINIKQIEPTAHFKVNGAYHEGLYKLEINCLLNEIYKNIKNSQMVIVILTKTPSINILKSTDSNYSIEGGKITFTIPNFNTYNNGKFMIGMLFQTNEQQFVEVVKVMYRYMVSLIYIIYIIYYIRIWCPLLIKLS